MAIIWRTKITILDPEKKNVSVILEQIDDSNPDDIKVLKTFSILDALIDTSERKQQVLDELERQYEADKKKVIDDTVTIGSLDDEIVAAVQTWETK